MLRLIKLLLLAAMLVALVVLALANSAPATVNLLPAPLADQVQVPTEFTFPLYVLLYGGVLFGLILGFLLELLREYPIRREARRRSAEAEALRKENRALKAEVGRGEHGDDVLALIDR